MHLILYIAYTVYYYMPAFTNNFTYGQYMMRAKGINLIHFCRNSSIQNLKLNKTPGIQPDFFRYPANPVSGRIVKITIWCTSILDQGNRTMHSVGKLFSFLRVHVSMFRKCRFQRAFSFAYIL